MADPHRALLLDVSASLNPRSGSDAVLKYFVHPDGMPGGSQLGKHQTCHSVPPSLFHRASIKVLGPPTDQLCPCCTPLEMDCVSAS